MENKNIEEIMSEFRGFFDEIENMEKQISNIDEKIENNRLTISHLNSDTIPSDKEFQKKLEENNSELEEEKNRKKMELEDKKSYDYAMKEDTVKALTQGKIKLEKERRKLEISMQKKNIEIEEFFAEDGEKTKTIFELYKEKDEIQNNINNISKEMETAEIYINEAKAKEVTSKQYKEIYIIEEQLEDEQAESSESPTQAQQTAMDESNEIEGISTSAYEMMSIEEKNDLLKQSKKEFITKYAMLFADKTDKQQDEIYNSLRGKLANELVDELRKNKTKQQTVATPIRTAKSQTPEQIQAEDPNIETKKDSTYKEGPKSELQSILEYMGDKEKHDLANLSKEDFMKKYENVFNGVRSAIEEERLYNKLKVYNEIVIDRDLTGSYINGKGILDCDVSQDTILKQLKSSELDESVIEYITKNGDPTIMAQLVNRDINLNEYYNLMIGKESLISEITYDLKGQMLSGVDREQKKEIKRMAYNARNYAKINAGPITKLQFLGFKIQDMIEKSKQKRLESKADKKFVNKYVKDDIQGPLTEQQETILAKKEQRANKFKNSLKIEQGEVKLTSEEKEQKNSRDNSPKNTLRKAFDYENPENMKITDLRNIQARGKAFDYENPEDMKITPLNKKMPREESDHGEIE